MTKLKICDVLEKEPNREFQIDELIEFTKSDRHSVHRACNSLLKEGKITYRIAFNRKGHWVNFYKFNGEWMSQKDIIDYLKCNPDNWVTRNELMNSLGLSLASANNSIRALIKAGEIERRYVRIDNPNKYGTQVVVTSIKLTNSFKNRLIREGLL